LGDASSVRFEFNCNKDQATHPARLRIHTADQSDASETVVQVTINGRMIEMTLPKGLGIQRKDPAHLAFPATLVADLAASDLHVGKNVLTVRVKGSGWYSWDSMDLVSRP
jgi:hypothetical protein